MLARYRLMFCLAQMVNAYRQQDKTTLRLYDLPVP
jgi:hypothetical protein